MRLDTIPTSQLWAVDQNDLQKYALDLTIIEFMVLGIKLMKAINKITIESMTMGELMANKELYELFTQRNKTIQFYILRLSDYQRTKDDK